MNAPLCKCGQPAREEQTLSELVTGTRFCVTCWQEKLALLRSGAVEQAAQTQYDKMMRDLESGMDPMEAWNRRGETDA